MDTTAQSPAAPEDKPFRFLDLLPELRNRIYVYALTTKSGDKIGVWTFAESGSRWEGSAVKRRRKSNQHWLAILETCRQINQEAKFIPFNCNIFRSGWEEDGLFHALCEMNIDQLAAVEAIEISTDEHELTGLGIPKLIPNLKYLRIVDSGVYGKLLLNSSDKSWESKIVSLRGLTKLEVVVEPYPGEWRGFNDADVQSAKKRAVKMTEKWNPIVTQPKTTAR